ncbi:MAG: hypothetical protein PHF67_00650 [Candidatus Nanoarchaeia archaeon]|nr:hypothetical protein [Candidatus Nanoarchaeia archaeon]
MSERRDITVHLWNGKGYDKHTLDFNKGDAGSYAECERRFLALLPPLGLSDRTAARYHSDFNGVSTALFNGYYRRGAEHASIALRPDKRIRLEPRL